MFGALIDTCEILTYMNLFLIITVFNEK